MQREIQKLDNEEIKLKNQIKAEAKKGSSQKTLNTLAKSMVQLRSSRDRLYTSKAQVNSVALQLKEMQASLKVAKAMKISTSVMASMNQMINLPRVRALAMNMSREMAKAGMIQEVITDTFEDLEEEDADEVAQEAVDKLLHEITHGQFGDIGTITNSVPVQEETEDMKDEEDDELEAMKARLEAL